MNSQGVSPGLLLAEPDFRHGGQREESFGWFPRQWPLFLHSLKASFEAAP
jgi:hypothetical protein